MKINPLLLTDAYKISHADQYPEGTEYVYSNITPRKSRMKTVDGVVVLGVRYFIEKYLVESFNENFFNLSEEEAVDSLQPFFDQYFGEGKVNIERYRRLHQLGYLPLKIKSLPEGTICPIGVPFMTMVNTDPEFYWLTNFIETLSQTVLWNFVTSATIAREYRLILDQYALETSDSEFLVDFQAHNFSMRGMSSIESGISSDMGHLLFFKGSDTLPGKLVIERYYAGDGLISCSVPATEHAVMCAGGKVDERETFRRLIQDIYPTGIVSIVSDTWDLWNVLTNIAPNLKDEIMTREGKVVFRPDSGNPVLIVCGYRVHEAGYNSEFVKHKATSQDWQLTFEHLNADAMLCTDGVYVDRHGKVRTENEIKGCIRLLDEQFGSTVNSKGYKELDPHVGLIYGDSITIERCVEICSRLKANGYASTNVVFGVGSYTYQYNTRDTFSIACKATWAQVKGEAFEIFKDPVTDDGTKKSACGLLKVEFNENMEIVLRDKVSAQEEKNGFLCTVFDNGLPTGLYFDDWTSITNLAKKSCLQA